MKSSSLIPSSRGCWRVLTCDKSKHHCMVYMVSGPSSDLDDTELPRLTSDFRLRRSAGGEILISVSRMNRLCETGPSWTARIRGAFFASWPSGLIHLSTSERFDRPRLRPVIGPRRGLFAFRTNPGLYLTPSNEHRRVMRFQCERIARQSVIRCGDREGRSNMKLWNTEEIPQQLSTFYHRLMTVDISVLRVVIEISDGMQYCQRIMEGFITITQRQVTKKIQIFKLWGE